MNQPADQGSRAPARGPGPGAPILTEAGRQLRASWAASIAGVSFAVPVTAARVLVRSQPML